MAEPDIVSLHRQAAAGFGRRLEAVRDEQWHDPTPCDQWDVRALANHVVGEQHWTGPLLDGQTIEQVGDRFDGDLLGDDPRAAWRAIVPEALAATDQPGVTERIVHLSYGDERAAEYLSQLTLDLAVHGWDLARATAGDETIDPALVTFLLDHFGPQEAILRGSGVFADAVEVPASADAQTKLLALLGRKA